MRRRAYRKPAQSYSGVRTWVTRDSQRGIPSDTQFRSDESGHYRNPGQSDVRDRALPFSEAAPSQIQKGIPQPWYNTPIYEKGTGEGFDDVKIQPRTLSEPGEEYGTPYKNDYGYVRRRTMTANVARQYLASFYRKEMAPHQLPQNWLDPGQSEDTGVPRVPVTEDGKANPATWSEQQESEQRPPSQFADRLDGGFVYNNPGSAKVIPPRSDLVNHGRWRYASAYIREIARNTSSEIKQRADRYSPRRKSFDRDKGLWTYGVGKYTVKLKASFDEGAETFRGARVKVRCSCPFWRWGGPEHWAQKEDYQLGPTRGTASKPDIRDPRGEHGCCKHVYAVLDHVRNRAAVDVG